MAFPATLVLKNAANADKNFIRVSADKQRVTYALDGASLSEPVTLQVAHTMSPALDGSNRHLLKLSFTELDANNRQRTAVVNMTIAMPKVGVARANLDDVIAYVKNFFVTSNVTAVLRGEL
jgi:hypothetical protein